MGAPDLPVVCLMPLFMHSEEVFNWLHIRSVIIEIGNWREKIKIRLRSVEGHFALRKIDLA